MGDVRASGCALILFGSLVLFASSASGQGCTPVVYAFRHAEDTNPPGAHPPAGTVPIFALTPTGVAHAKLYPAMIRDFEAAKKFCQVAKVYAATTAGKESPCGSECASATNAFDTATPLAKEVMPSVPPIPITTVVTDVGEKQLYEYLGNGNKAPQLYEYVKNPNPDPAYDTDTAKALRRELLATANLGYSSAIFWTSQGLHVLGGAIIKGTSRVPDKNSPTNKATPPRNAVYVFAADVSASPIAGFIDTPSPPSLYVQCFNHVEPSAGKFSFPQFTDPYYFCGFGSQASPGGTPNKPGSEPETPCDEGAQCGTISNEENAKLKGKICKTTDLSKPPPELVKPGADLYGACQ